MNTAKVLRKGNSQTIKLPKGLCFDANIEEVRVRRHGSTIILEPIPKDWKWLEALIAEHGGFDDDFVAAVNEEPVQGL